MSTASFQEIEEEKKEALLAKKKAKNPLLGFLQNYAPEGDDEEGSLELSFAGLFRCMFCTYPKPVDEKQQLIRIADSLSTLEKRLDNIERLVDM